MWVIAESSVPAIRNQTRLAYAVNLMFNSCACSSFILWYLDRGRSRDEDRARAVAEEHDRAIRETARLVYSVAFADGVDEERNSRQVDNEIGNIVSLDERRAAEVHTPPRQTGNNTR